MMEVHRLNRLNRPDNHFELWEFELMGVTYWYYTNPYDDYGDSILQAYSSVQCWDNSGEVLTTTRWELSEHLSLMGVEPAEAEQRILRVLTEGVEETEEVMYP